MVLGWFIIKEMGDGQYFVLGAATTTLTAVF